jgi:hypothetical protein
VYVFGPPRIVLSSKATLQWLRCGRNTLQCRFERVRDPWADEDVAGLTAGEQATPDKPMVDMALYAIHLICARTTPVYGVL